MNGMVSPYVRIPFFHERGPGIGIDKSLQERLDDIYSGEKEERINIGFKKTSSGMVDKETVTSWRKEMRKNKSLEKAAREGTLQVDLDKVKEEWLLSGAVFNDIYKSAELYGIYEDLFRHGYFDPCVELEVAYSLDNDMMAPVYRGNMIKPSEAAAAPEVSWKSGPDDLWSLVLTGLDSHLTEEGQEYIHWMVANIKGGDITSGQEVASYLQPFPAFGTGYHRFAFVLYKQEAEIDFSAESRLKDPVDLKERTFNTFDFYSKHQDSLTPAGLAFFQSDYEPGLRDFFHNTLNMKEPRFEYEFPLPYIKSWSSIKQRTGDVGFNEFMDRYRDPKELEKEVLLKKLKHTHPFEGDTEEYIKYPLAHERELKDPLPAPMGQKEFNRKQSYKIASWRRYQILRERSKVGYYSSTDHQELRRDPALSSQ